MKSLIVTADDVGLHPGMTEGALRAHRQGIVTACSVVANGKAFGHAVERLRDTPSISAGVHLTLVGETPVARGGSLIGADGRLFSSYAKFVPRYLARAIVIADVEREFRAQIEALLAAGVHLTHANGHQHLHLLPRIFDVVQRLAIEYAIGYVRIVDDRGGCSTLSRRMSVDALSMLGRRARRRSTARTNDRTIGVAEAGHLDAAAVIRLLDSVEGVTELVVHPGVDGAALGAAYRWSYAWDAETAALCDPRVRAAVGQSGIRLAAPACES